MNIYYFDKNKLIFKKINLKLGIIILIVLGLVGAIFMQFDIVKMVA
jgi:CHASE3 domain sensor protein